MSGGQGGCLLCDNLHLLIPQTGGKCTLRTQFTTPDTLPLIFFRGWAVTDTRSGQRVWPKEGKGNSRGIWVWTGKRASIARCGLFLPPSYISASSTPTPVAEVADGSSKQVEDKRPEHKRFRSAGQDQPYPHLWYGRTCESYQNGDQLASMLGWWPWFCPPLTVDDDAPSTAHWN